MGWNPMKTLERGLGDVYKRQDIYHVSFHQYNDQSNITVETFDCNMYVTNVAAEFDAYLYLSLIHI